MEQNKISQGHILAEYSLFWNDQELTIQENQCISSFRPAQFTGKVTNWWFLERSVCTMSLEMTEQAMLESSWTDVLYNVLGKGIVRTCLQLSENS